MFLSRNKKNIDTFWLKKAPYQELCPPLPSPPHLPAHALSIAPRPDTVERVCYSFILQYLGMSAGSKVDMFQFLGQAWYIKGDKV